MKLKLIVSALLLGAMPAIVFAQAAKADSAAGHASCDDMKQRIASQIEGHGVKQYTLEIADAASPGEGKVVAHCEGGKKVVVYSKGGAAKSDAKSNAGK
jgi:hypothetical protein